MAKSNNNISTDRKSNKGKILVDPKQLKSLLDQVSNKDWSQDWLKGIEANQLAMGKTQVTNPFNQSSLVHTCIKIIGQNFPQAPFDIYKNGQLVDDKNDPVYDFFQQPNDLMSRFEFWEALSASYSLYGETFVYVVPSIGNTMNIGALPSEMLVIHPRTMKEVVDTSTGKLKGWMFRGGGKEIAFELFEIIHIKSYNPNNPYRGASPIDSIQIALNIDFSSETYAEKFFQNGAAPLGIISMGEDSDDSISEMKKILKLWNSAHQGSKKSHKIGILRNGMTYSSTGLSQKEMDFIEGRKFTREQILSVLNVPPPVVGIYEGSEYASTKIAKGLFWNENLKPIGIRVQEVYQIKFFKRYAPQYSGVFNYDNIEALQKDYKDRTEEAKTLWTLGVPLNILNERLNLGLPELTDQDVGYIPISFVPISASGDIYNVGNEDLPEDTVGDVHGENVVVPDKSVAVKDARSKRIQLMTHTLEIKYEKIFQSKIKRHFFEQRKKILGIVLSFDKNTLDSVKLTAELDIFEEENKNLTKLIGPIYTDIVKDSQKLALEVLGIDREVILNEQLVLSKVHHINGINDTIYKQLIKQIFHGIDNIATIEDLAKCVKSIYNSATNKTRLIARTEVTQTVSEASMLEYKSDGVKYYQWLTSDDRASKEHVANQEAGPIRIGESFPSGEKFPCQSSPGCRCTIQPAIKD